MDAATRDAAMAAEPDRYLAATLAPRAAQRPLAVVAAFAAELARIPATVSEPMLGSIRLQWWRDTLEAAATGQRSGHPIADALADIANARKLDLTLAQAMIDAREFDLSGGLHTDDTGLFAYLEATEAHPFRLALALLEAPAGCIQAVATSAGRAYGLARALSRMPMLLHNGGLPVTAGRLRSANCDADELTARPLAPKTIAALQEVTKPLTAIARAERDKVRAAWSELPRTARTALLPLAMVEPYLSLNRPLVRLDGMAQVSPLSRTARIGLAYMAGRI
ncbi:MAG: squalene/phytoene synthase family protein [Hyphomicrobiaceae bacterium]